MSLVGKVAIITGADNTVGAAVAIKFADENAQVAIVGRNEIKLEKVAKICKERGSKPAIIVADITIDTDVVGIINKTLSLFGKIDILINSSDLVDHFHINDKEAMLRYDKIVLTNFRSVVYLTYLAAEHLCATKGNIINIGSVKAHTITTDDSFAYVSSKAGLENFTKNIAVDFASKGVRVNIICPGPVKSEIFERNVGEPGTTNTWQLMENEMPLSRVSEAEEIADLVAYIASDKGRSFTGSSIVVDNGMLLKWKFLS